MFCIPFNSKYNPKPFSIDSGTIASEGVKTILNVTWTPTVYSISCESFSFRLYELPFSSIYSHTSVSFDIEFL